MNTERRGTIDGVLVRVCVYVKQARRFENSRALFQFTVEMGLCVVLYI